MVPPGREWDISRDPQCQFTDDESDDGQDPQWHPDSEEWDVPHDLRCRRFTCRGEPDPPEFADVETDTDPRMVDADQIPPSNDPNRRLNPPRIPFPLLMHPTTLAYMCPGSVDYAQYSSRPVTSYDDSDDDDWDEPVARLPGSGTTSPSHKDGGGDDEAGGEDDEASGGGHAGDVSSVAGTPAPIGSRVRSLERRVSSLYKGRSVLDSPVPDGLCEPLLPLAVAPPNGARLHWRRVLRMLRWRRVQHEWTAWMRTQPVASSAPLLDVPVPAGLREPLLPSVPDVPQPMCAAAVIGAALASGALPALLCEVVKCAAAVSAAVPGAACGASDASCLRQRRRGVRGGRRAQSRRVAKRH